MLMLLTSIAQAATVQLEVDPLAFGLSGFAAHARVALPESRWTLGAGTYAMDLPAPMVELAPENRGEQWSARLEPSLGLFVDRYAERAAEGQHLGVQLALHRWEVSREGERAGLSSLLLMPRVGYVWTPFEDLGFYLDPWLGVGATAPITGEAVAGGEAYQLFPLMVFGAVHLGWRFEAGR